MKNIIDFYDEYISYQLNSGINDRIYSIYKRLVKLGLSKASTILEIGCGIGSLTYLLSRKIQNGKIEAIDISPKSIEYAKKHLPTPNLKLTACNALEYHPSSDYFDMILMMDVLEHIPIENHEALFSKIYSWMGYNSFLFINLPNPDYIIYDQQHNPGLLQELDQPIFLQHLINTFTKTSLELCYFENYSIWVENDYHFLIVKKKQPFTERKLSDKRTKFEKANV